MKSLWQYCFSSGQALLPTLTCSLGGTAHHPLPRQMLMVLTVTVPCRAGAADPSSPSGCLCLAAGPRWATQSGISVETLDHSLYLPPRLCCENVSLRMWGHGESLQCSQFLTGRLAGWTLVMSNPGLSCG